MAESLVNITMSMRDIRWSTILFSSVVLLPEQPQQLREEMGGLDGEDGG